MTRNVRQFSNFSTRHWAPASTFPRGARLSLVAGETWYLDDSSYAAILVEPNAHPTLYRLDSVCSGEGIRWLGLHPILPEPLQAGPGEGALGQSCPMWQHGCLLLAAPGLKWWRIGVGLHPHSGEESNGKAPLCLITSQVQHLALQQSLLGNIPTLQTLRELGTSPCDRERSGNPFAKHCRILLRAEAGKLGLGGKGEQQRTPKQHNITQVSASSVENILSSP